jgi:mRNA interferase MazF
MMHKRLFRVRQGDIWLTDLNPVKGSEQAGFRPVVVLSGNMLNDIMPVIFAAPLTTQIKGFKGNPLILPDEGNGLDQTSELLIFHFRSISRERLKEKIGTVKPEIIKTAITTLNDLLKY